MPLKALLDSLLLPWSYTLQPFRMHCIMVNLRPHRFSKTLIVRNTDII